MSTARRAYEPDHTRSRTGARVRGPGWRRARAPAARANTRSTGGPERAGRVHGVFEPASPWTTGRADASAPRAGPGIRRAAAGTARGHVTAADHAAQTCAGRDGSAAIAARRTR